MFRYIIIIIYEVPTYAGVNCTDLPAPANVSGYTCGPCPTGFTGNGAQCAGRCIQEKEACLVEFGVISD